MSMEPNEYQKEQCSQQDLLNEKCQVQSTFKVKLN